MRVVWKTVCATASRRYRLRLARMVVIKIVPHAVRIHIRLVTLCEAEDCATR